MPVYPSSYLIRLSLSVCVVLVSVCQCLPLSGWIQSPGFPYGYGSHVSETWRRCAPPGHILSLTLLHLDLEESYECKDDALQVEDRNQLAFYCLYFPHFSPSPLCFFTFFFLLYSLSFLSLVSRFFSLFVCLRYFSVLLFFLRVFLFIFSCLAPFVNF